MSPRLEKSAQSPADRTQRDLCAWSLLTGLVLLAVLAGPFFAGRIYTRDDLGAFHLPARAFYARQLARGEPFDWMPQLYSGFYLTGEGQAGTYHPLHLVLYRCLPLRVALGCEWLTAYPVMMAGTWFFLRRRLRRRDAAMLGSLLFTFSSFNLLHFIHPNAVAIVAHIPWLLWAIDVALVDSGRRKVALAQAGIALLTASQLLLGYPQYVWFSLIAEAAYAGFVLAGRKYASRGRCHELAAPGGHVGRNSSPWARLVIAKGCGLLLGGVQLLPTIDALAHSARLSADAAFADWGSLHPMNLVQLVAPYMFISRVVGQNTHELGLYAGAVPLMLVVWLVVRRRKLGTLGALASAAGGFGLLALLLALGKYGQIYRLQRYLPLVGRFRFPCRYLMLFQLAFTVLAAIGFVLLVRDYRRSRRRRGQAPPVPGAPQRPARWRRFDALWVVVALSGVVAMVGLVFQNRSWMASVPAVLAGPLLLGTAAVLLALAASGVRAALVGLILFAAVDLGAYGMTYAVYPHTVQSRRFVASVPTPPGDTDGRVLADLAGFDEEKIRTGNQITLAGWHRADGYAGLEPRRQLDYHRLPALRTAGVRWVKRTEAAAEIEGLIPHDEHWLEVPRPLPRVRLVSRAQTSDDPAGDINRIVIESTALTEVPLALPEAPPGTAELLDQRPGRLHIRCDCSSPQLLVVSESFYPGWRATVDGKPQPVLRINGDFMGCLVTPGGHQVVLEFRPRSLHRGWIVSGVGLSLVLVCFVGCYVRPTSRPVEDRFP